MSQLTHLGQIVATQTLFATLAGLGLDQDSTLRPLNNRHAAGDWGDPGLSLRPGQQNIKENGQ